MTWRREELECPLGIITLVHDGRRLAALDFDGHEDRFEASCRHFLKAPVTERHRGTSSIAKIMMRYFQGDLDAPDALEVATLGTPFQARVWAALRTVRAGKTATYGDIARLVGAPKATRAVGMTNGRNPIAIVVPCHRIIGANGALTGYAGGLERKAWLLRHEGAMSEPMLDLRKPMGATLLGNTPHAQPIET